MRLEQLERLSFLLGTWNASDIYEKSPFAPDGGSGSGVYKTVSGQAGYLS